MTTMASDRTFELRTYRSAPGKLEGITARFRDHTMALFAEHGIEVIGFWSAADEDDPSTGTLEYVCAYADRASRERSWAAFMEDPRWLDARAKSEVDGPLVSSVVSLFMQPTDFSPIR